VVHIASHAEFSGDPHSSFVLTYDDRIDMEELASLVRAGARHGAPVELLMLSACETAAGDERAALGLAGVAIRAGARSAMGSLWSVSDETTAVLVADFYDAMDIPGLNKAGALRRERLSGLQGQVRPRRKWVPSSCRSESPKYRMCFKRWPQ